MLNKIHNKLDSFLTAASRTSGVSTVIYNSSTSDITLLKHSLVENGYQEVYFIEDFINRLDRDLKLALYTNNIQPTEIVNLVSQINFGKISMPDSYGNQFYVKDQIIAHSILIIQKDQLEYIQAKGLKILENANMSYQI